MNVQVRYCWVIGGYFWVIGVLSIFDKGGFRQNEFVWIYVPRRLRCKHDHVYT